MFESFKFRAFKAYLVYCIIYLDSSMKDPSRLISIPKDTGKPECHKVIIIFDEEQVTTLMMVIKHFVVSGSGSKVSHLKLNDKLDFGAEHAGFAKLEIYESGETVLKYFSAELEQRDNPIIYNKQIYTKNIKDNIKICHFLPLFKMSRINEHDQ